MSAERISIQPTYDHGETGDRFSVTTRVEGRLVSSTDLRDPFLIHRVVIGWHDLLRGFLRRRLEVVVTVDGDADIVEDVCELDADYLGSARSSRRREWNAQVDEALAAVPAVGHGDNPAECGHGDQA